MEFGIIMEHITLPEPRKTDPSPVFGRDFPGKIVQWFEDYF